MITEAQALEALRNVMDPELGRNIVELGMVRQVAIEGDKVRVTIALTVPNCPLRDQIAENAGKAIDALADGLDVEIVLTEMTEEEKARLRERLGQKRQTTGQFPAGNLNRIRTVIAVMSGKGGVDGGSHAGSRLATSRTPGRRSGCRHHRPEHPQAFRRQRATNYVPFGHHATPDSSGHQADVDQSDA